MYKIAVEIPEGWGVILVVQKMEIPGRRGVLRETPSVVGVWIFSGTTQFNFHFFDTNFRFKVLIYEFLDISDAESCPG